jgi:putative ABC transport system substrate-binding protein
MNRRDLIKLLGGAAAAWPVAARAQAKMPVIGVLTSGTISSSGLWIAAFDQRLRELGWIEGRTIAVVHRFAEGHIERYSGIMAEFVRLNVDVIVAGGTAVTAAKDPSGSYCSRARALGLTV